MKANARRQAAAMETRASMPGTSATARVDKQADAAVARRAARPSQLT